MVPANHDKPRDGRPLANQSCVTALVVVYPTEKIRSQPLGLVHMSLDQVRSVLRKCSGANSGFLVIGKRGKGGSWKRLSFHDGPRLDDALAIVLLEGLQNVAFRDSLGLLARLGDAFSELAHRTVDALLLRAAILAGVAES